MNIIEHFSESLEKVFRARIEILKFFEADPDPGSGIFLILDRGPGMEKFAVMIDVNKDNNVTELDPATFVGAEAPR
jgi:hypothetical protein